MGKQIVHINRLVLPVSKSPPTEWSPTPNDESTTIWGECNALAFIKHCQFAVIFTSFCCLVYDYALIGMIK